MKQLFFLYANMVTIQIFGAILMGKFSNITQEIWLLFYSSSWFPSDLNLILLRKSTSRDILIQAYKAYVKPRKEYYIQIIELCS